MTPEFMLDLKITVRTLITLMEHAESLKQHSVVDKDTHAQMERYIEGSGIVLEQIQTLIDSAEERKNK